MRAGVRGEELRGGLDVTGGEQEEINSSFRDLGYALPPLHKPGERKAGRDRHENGDQNHCLLHCITPYFSDPGKGMS